MCCTSVNCHSQCLMVALCLCRSQPHRAAIWLPWKDKPNAQFHVQLWEGRCENMAPPGRELWTEEGWDWGHDRWHAALWPHQHSRLQHSRAAHKTGADRAARCCGVLMCGHTWVGRACSPSLPTTHDILRSQPVGGTKDPKRALELWVLPTDC